MGHGCCRLRGGGTCGIESHLSAGEGRYVLYLKERPIAPLSKVVTTKVKKDEGKKKGIKVKSHDKIAAFGSLQLALPAKAPKRSEYPRGHGEPNLACAITPGECTPGRGVGEGWQLALGDTRISWETLLGASRLLDRQVCWGACSTRGTQKKKKGTSQEGECKRLGFGDSVCGKLNSQKKPGVVDGEKSSRGYRASKRDNHVLCKKARLRS